MMQENEANKKKQLDIREQERVNDIRSMEDYARMLDKQEEDRLNEIKAREERQQLLMARMADTVLKEQKQKNLEEDLMLLKQFDEKSYWINRKMRGDWPSYRNRNWRSVKFWIKRSKISKKGEKIKN